MSGEHLVVPPNKEVFKQKTMTTTNNDKMAKEHEASFNGHPLAKSL